MPVEEYKVFRTGMPGKLPGEVFRCLQVIECLPDRNFAAYAFAEPIIACARRDAVLDSCGKDSGGICSDGFRQKSTGLIIVCADICFDDVFQRIIAFIDRGINYDDRDFIADEFCKFLLRPVIFSGIDRRKDDTLDIICFTEFSECGNVIELAIFICFQ